MFILLSVIFFDLYSLWKAFVISINPFQVWWQQLNLISPSLSHSPAGHHFTLKEGKALATDPSRIHSCPFQLGEKKHFQGFGFRERNDIVYTANRFYSSVFLIYSASVCIFQTVLWYLHLFSQQKMITQYMYMIYNNNLGLYSFKPTRYFKPTLYYAYFLCAQTLCVNIFHLSCVYECIQIIVSRISCLGLWSESSDRCALGTSLNLSLVFQIPVIHGCGGIYPSS